MQETSACADVIDVSGDSNPKGSMLCDGPAEGVDDANKQSIRRGPRIKAGQIHHGRNEFHTVKERFKALGDKIDGAKGSLRPRRPA